MSSALLESLGSYFNRGAPSLESMLKFSNLDARVSKHLSRVYAILACAAAVCALGCYANITMQLHPALTQIGAIASLLTLTFMAATPSNQNKRLAALGGFAFCQGAALAPLVQLALYVQPSVIVTAFAATTAVFVCFSLSALTTQRRAYMYLGGYLASATTAMLVLRLGVWAFGRSQALYSLELYGGLLMFSAYILYDTQLIVERASAGDFDEVRHALDLLVDVIAIFVRILVILLNNAAKEEERKRKEEQRRRR